MTGGTTLESKRSALGFEYVVSDEANASRSNKEQSSLVLPTKPRAVHLEQTNIPKHILPMCMGQ
jgi:hypothetical protein